MRGNEGSLTCAGHAVDVTLIKRRADMTYESNENSNMMIMQVLYLPPAFQQQHGHHHTIIYIDTTQIQL